MEPHDIETGSKHYSTYTVSPKLRSISTIVLIVLFLASAAGTVAGVWSVAHADNAPVMVP